MKTVRNYSQQLSCIMYSSVNYIYHVVHYFPSTYLSYNWMFHYLYLTDEESDPVMLNNCTSFMGLKG